MAFTNLWYISANGKSLPTLTCYTHLLTFYCHQPQKIMLLYYLVSWSGSSPFSDPLTCYQNLPTNSILFINYLEPHFVFTAGASSYLFSTQKIANLQMNFYTYRYQPYLVDRSASFHYCSKTFIISKVILRTHQHS